MADNRITDYDRIADRFDTRYAHYSYDGVRETLVNFLGPQPSTVLEVGCGTGHWLSIAHAERSPLVGVDPSQPMLDRARVAAPGARLVRARAEALPWRDATFDRIYCVNALHHFSDRVQFFAEARRILRPGGGVLTIGKDPHTDRDDWWVYDYFEETRTIDRARFARVRTLRGEMALAGFAWTESMEADHIEVVQPARERWPTVSSIRALPRSCGARGRNTNEGADRLRQANDAAAANWLVADFRLPRRSAGSDHRRIRNPETLLAGRAHAGGLRGAELCLDDARHARDA
jgi:ubiquinone/menaquinone biosynthesis C-methylase UbiE